MARRWTSPSKSPEVGLEAEASPSPQDCVTGAISRPPSRLASRSRRRCCCALTLPPSDTAPKRKRKSAALTPEQAAKAAIARRAKPSAVPGHVRLVLNLDIPRALAERLSARAIREGKNLEA